MGGSSSSRSSSSNYSSIDNSYHELNATEEYDDSFNTDNSKNYEDSFNTYTDHGALEVAESLVSNSLDLAQMSIESVGEREQMALNAVTSIGQSALSHVASSYKESDAETMQTIFKYSAITAAVISAAILLKGK